MTTTPKSRPDHGVVMLAAVAISALLLLAGCAGGGGDDKGVNLSNLEDKTNEAQQNLDTDECNGNPIIGVIPARLSARERSACIHVVECVWSDQGSKMTTNEWIALREGLVGDTGDFGTATLTAAQKQLLNSCGLSFK
jgi:hypothetical protein